MMFAIYSMALILLVIWLWVWVWELPTFVSELPYSLKPSTYYQEQMILRVRAAEPLQVGDMVSLGLSRNPKYHTSASKGNVCATYCVLDAAQTGEPVTILVRGFHPAARLSQPVKAGTYLTIDPTVFGVSLDDTKDNGTTPIYLFGYNNNG